MLYKLYSKHIQIYLPLFQPIIEKWSQQERIAPFPVKTWMDLLQDLEEPDRNVGAGDGDEEEEEPGNATSDASEAAAVLLQTEVGQCEVN